MLRSRVQVPVSLQNKIVWLFIAAQAEPVRSRDDSSIEEKGEIDLRFLPFLLAVGGKALPVCSVSFANFAGVGIPKYLAVNKNQPFSEICKNSSMDLAGCDFIKLEQQ